MRVYHIYRQVAQLKDAHVYSSIYKWMPREYIGYVYGTKNLKSYFDNMGRYARRSFSNKFLTGTFKRSYPTYSTIFYRGNEEEYNMTAYIIVDDKGNIRDYGDLTKRYQKKRNYSRYHGAYQCRTRESLMHDRRKSITPEEIRDIKNEYGFTLLPLSPKRDIDPWDLSECVKRSKGWKTQSKRKRQYKEAV